MNLIIDILKNNYNLDVRDIAPAPRGFVAETYFVYTDKETYFLKIFNNQRFTKNVVINLPALYELNKLGIDFITTPVKTNSGEFYVFTCSKLFVLYNYIIGNRTSSYNTREYFKLLSEVYSKTDRLRHLPLSVEKFEIPVLKEYVKYIDDFLNYNKDDKIILKTKDVLLSHRQQLDQYWNVFPQISKQCRKTHKDYYITHGDGSGNVMAHGDNLYIVDWDDMLLAPIERDSWFYLDDEKQLHCFENVLYEKGIKYHFSTDYFRFYTYKRFLEDLTDYLEVIIQSDDDLVKEKMYSDMQDTCFTWLYKFIQLLG